jgi:hypothetical protein
MNTTTTRGAAACGCEEPIHFAGTQLGRERHVCALFRSADEEYRVLMPYILEGFERGEKAFHVVPPKRRSNHLQRMVAAGVDVVAAQDRGQFELCDWEKMYLPDGRFDQDRSLAAWDAAFELAVSQGFPRTRLVAHMEWCLEEREGVNDLLEYEARLNLRPRDRDPIVCTYDLNRYGSAFIVDVMRTHPMILVGGLVQENPFYTPPDEFIRELHGRKARETAAVI